ncbi:hypothetical protein ACFWGC_29270 [Cytobacillus pseudoceanisediminis]|uniref:hypothetical protein n=1 Tax=Cytobacillus pseudoceanisediminis TaxID=3051614 RepID=UPI00364FFE6F
MLNEEKAILSSISMEGVNQQIEIYTGEYTLDIDGNKVVLEGNILMKWLPDARIEYKGKVVEGYKEIERDLLVYGIIKM